MEIFNSASVHKTFIYVLGLPKVWVTQDFGYGRAAGVVSVRRNQELPPCRTKPASAGSRRYPLLTSAELGNTGDTSVITYIRKGKKHCAAAVREE